jgi:hypothetical protein
MAGGQPNGTPHPKPIVQPRPMPKPPQQPRPSR